MVGTAANYIATPDCNFFVSRNISNFLNDRIMMMIFSDEF